MANRFSPQRPEHFPEWTRTLGAMKDQGIVPRAWCTTCMVSVDVDLDRLIAAKGRDYSLINRRCRCVLTDGCAGWVRFQYSSHGCRRWLFTDPQAMRWTFG